MTTAGAFGLGAVGLPSPSLFAAILAGIVVALRFRGVLALAPRTFRAAQAVTGVVLGSYVQSSALTAVAGSWFPIAIVCGATLAISLLMGEALARFARVDGPTASLGMVAGGASGIVGMSADLGADDRLVAFMQYLRVLVVVLATPVIVTVAFGEGDSITEIAGGATTLGDLSGWGLTAVAVIVGGTLATVARLPVASLLGPMIITAGFALAFPADAVEVPSILRDVAFAVLGLQVGLGFTVATMREVGRLLLPVLATIVVLVVACFGLALLLAATTPASLMDSYLATTPGGLYAVVATAYGSQADTTFIVATQTLRLFVMVLLAPFVVRMRYRKPARSAA